MTMLFPKCRVTSLSGTAIVGAGIGKYCSASRVVGSGSAHHSAATEWRWTVEGQDHGRSTPDSCTIGLCAPVNRTRPVYQLNQCLPPIPDPERRRSPVGIA